MDSYPDSEGSFISVERDFDSEMESLARYTKSCNVEWDSDLDIDWRARAYMLHSWELYSHEAEDEQEGHEGRTPNYQCKACNSYRDAEPHFLLYVLHGKLCDEPQTEPSDMDPFLWSSLPSEMLERVLAMLPASIRIRFSVVCKQWNELFFASPDFKKLCMNVEMMQNDTCFPAVCALEYQPGHLAPGCQPRWSDISYLSKKQKLKVYKIGLSFLPKKFQFFLPLDCVIQDGYICIYRAQRALGEGMKKLSFCVANPLTKSWKELPPQFCTCEEYDLWRKDWTVYLEVRRNNFTVSLIMSRLIDEECRMTVNTYHSEIGVWKLVCLQDMSYVIPNYVPEGGQWPCYAVSGGFLFSGNCRQARLETMIHNADTGEVIYFHDDTDNGEEGASAYPPPLKLNEANGTPLSYESWMDFPLKVISNCNGFFCAARYFCRKSYRLRTGLRAVERNIEGHVGKALGLLGKKHQRSGYTIWKLDLSAGVWKQLSISSLPKPIKQELRKRPLWNRHQPYCARCPKDGHTLFLDEAVISRDTIFLKIEIKKDYCVPNSSDVCLWTGLVSYHIPNDSWKTIYTGLVPRLCGNEWHIFSPVFTDAVLCQEAGFLSVSIVS